jgi:hypothetical protein
MPVKELDMLNTQEKDFSAFTADDILKAWLKALVDGLGPGRTFAPEIIDLKGDTAKGLRLTINDELERRRKSTTGPKTFDAAAFRASTRVAKDLGAICAIMADATKDKVVTLDVFQAAKALTDQHPSCPREQIGGAGPFC